MSTRTTKFILTILMVAQGSTALLADDITTLSGTKYQNVTVTRVEPDGLRITADAGVTKVPFTDLPKDIQAKYGYDPEKAAQYTAATQAAAAQRAKAQAEQQRAKEIDESLNNLEYDMQGDIIQMTEDGAIVRGLASKGGKTLPGIFYVFGMPRSFVDGNDFRAKVYAIGNHRYPTVNGATKTVLAFSTTKEDAFKRIRAIAKSAENK